MNYAKIYEQLMVRSQGRDKPEGYVERHHILPKHAGGTDAKSNLVYLTAREHFIAHLLRAKAFGGKDIHAVNRMSTSQGNLHYKNGRLFEIARKLFAENNSGDNNWMRKNPEMVPKGETSPRKRNPESYAHLKGVKRTINSAKGDKHPRKKNPELWDNLKGDKHPRKKNPELWAKATGDTHWTKNNEEFSARMKTDNPMRRPSVIERFKGKNNKLARSVKCVETNKVFDTLREAADHVKGNVGNIWSACNGRLKKAYGFRWEYVNIVV